MPDVQEQRKLCQCCGETFNPGDVIRYQAERVKVNIEPITENFSDSSIETPCIIADIGLCEGCYHRLIGLNHQGKLKNAQLTLRFVRDYSRLSPHGRPEVRNFRLLVLLCGKLEVSFADFLDQLGSPWNLPWQYSQAEGIWAPTSITD